MLDSGAFWSTLSPATAQQYHLHLDYGRLPGLYVRGVGGNAQAAVTTVRTFTVFNVPFHNVDFIVGGSEPGNGTVGLLGQNFLRIADVEYDLSRGSLALFKPENCKHTDLAYWVKGGEPYSVMDIEETTPLEPHTTGKVNLNGAKVRVEFDTGAGSSIVGLHAAAAAGVKPGGPGVEPAGYTTGIGRQTVQTWVATFPVLKIGDEEVHNARLRFGDLGVVDKYRQRKGDATGAVADLDAVDRAAPKEADVRLALAMVYEELDQWAQAIAQTNLWIPLHEQDPRVVQAYNARCWARAAQGQELEQALRDCNAGLRVNPSALELLDSRGLVNLRRKQFDKAIADYSAALKINPNIAWSLYGRGIAELRKGMTARGEADIAAAKALAPHLPQTAQRLGVGP
jgi:predicted aspartyl protease/Tfp pilus assembly protein PilF